MLPSKSYPMNATDEEKAVLDAEEMRMDLESEIANAMVDEVMESAKQHAAFLPPATVEGILECLESRLHDDNSERRVMARLAAKKGATP